MKKTIFLFSLVAGLFVANAQTTGSTNLKVNLHPVISISVNHTEVIVDFKTEADYTSGVTVPMADHLTVFSTGKFKVEVTAGDTNLKNGAETGMATSDVSIIASNGTKILGDANYSTGVLALTTSPQPLFTSPKGGGNRTFNVAYKVTPAAGTNPGDLSYTDLVVNNVLTTYQTAVTYTVTAL